MDAIWDKSVINRSDFKYNFLETGILRLDYSGVIDTEDIIKDMAEDLKSYGFAYDSENYINNVSIKLLDPVQLENANSVPIENISKNKSFKFIDKNQNILEISRIYLTLTINYKKYVNFETYIDLFSKISKKLNSTRSFIKPLRIGERKINTLFFTKESLIKDYFEHPYFESPYLINSSNLVKIEGCNPELMVHEAIDTLKIGKKNVNIKRHLSNGVLRTPEDSDKNVSRLVLDIDCYSVENLYMSNILEGNNIETKLNDLNNLCFDIFKNSLTCQFIKLLTTSDSNIDKNKDLIGIRRSYDL